MSWRRLENLKTSRKTYVSKTSSKQPTQHFLERKKIFLLKLENIKFLHVTNMWDFSSFIEQDISDKTFSEFVVSAVNQATTVTNNEFVSFCF